MSKVIGEEGRGERGGARREGCRVVEGVMPDAVMVGERRTDEAAVAVLLD